MNLVCDEGVERPIVEHLREHGHDVLYIAEFDPSIDDEAVLAPANQHRAPLVTTDKDFGELVFRQGLASSGVVLIGLQAFPTKPRRASSLKPSANIPTKFSGRLR